MENPGSQQYTKALNADYELLKQLVLTVDEKYKLGSECLKELEDVCYFALTSDSNKSFISVTAHFIKETTLKSVVISTSEITMYHTAK